MTGSDVYSWDELRQGPKPQEVWMTPFGVRLFAAGLGVVASILVSFALVSVLLPHMLDAAASDELTLFIGGSLAVLTSALSLRFFNPLDWGKWFCFALAAEGIYLPGSRRRLVFVPWSAVAAIDVERWHYKGEHSAARIRLDLDDEIWSDFRRGARIRGHGRRRWVTVHVPGVNGEEMAARIKDFRAMSSAGPG